MVPCDAPPTTPRPTVTNLEPEPLLPNGGRPTAARILFFVAVAIAVMLFVAVIARAVGRDDVDEAVTEGTSTTSEPAAGTSAPVSSTTEATLADASRAWDGVEVFLRPGVASSGLLEGPEPLGVTAEGRDVTIWTWNGDAWKQTYFLVLGSEVTGADAIERVDLTGGPWPDLVFRQRDDAASVVTLPDPIGRLATFDRPLPDGPTSTLRRLEVSDETVTGSIEGEDEARTWVYDAKRERFVLT